MGSKGERRVAEGGEGGGEGEKQDENGEDFQLSPGYFVLALYFINVVTNIYLKGRLGHHYLTCSMAMKVMEEAREALLMSFSKCQVAEFPITEVLNHQR